MKKLLAGLLVLSLVVVGGYATVQMSIIGGSQENVGEVSEQSQNLACSNSLDMLEQSMSTGDERTIPDPCFNSEGELTTSRLSGAEPGDNLRKTESGLEVAN